MHRALMGLYAGQGRRGAALRQYQICVAVLQRELGVEPEEPTKRLYQEILQTPLVPSAVSSPADLAENRPTRPPAAAPTDSVPDAPLVGREAQMAALRRARDEAWRGRARIGVIWLS